MQQPQAGLEITTIVPWWLFTVRIFPAKVSIDGSAPMAAKWGDNLIPMTPGRHTVQFWWNAYWFLPSNKGEVVVDIPQGQVAQLQYKPRWMIFMAGILQWVAVRPMLQPGAAGAVGAAQAAGWNPDPSGKHELRYWNGTGWTEDVSDSGVTAKDPLT
jgi:hypothetical protein